MHLIHGKGILTVLFVSISEGVHIANAVSFYNTYQKWSSQHGRRSKEQFSGQANRQLHKNTDDQPSSKSCPAPGPNSPLRLNRLLKKDISSRTNAKDCCLECCDRVADLDSKSVCDALRGGHVDAIRDAASVAPHQPTPYDLPLYVWKIIFQFFLTSINVFFWLVPLKSKRLTENKLGLSMANAFSGGVFLSLAFGHLIPECVHGFHGYGEAVPYMFVLAGYLLIFFVEKVAFDTHAFLDHDHGRDHEHTNDSKKVTQNGNSLSKSDEKDAKDEGASTGRSAVILLGALAVHSVLEMTALGLANSFGDSALLSLSIALHQPAESIALLVAFLKSGMPKPQIITYLSIFSTMGPIGVALGMLVKNVAAPIVDAIMLAIVAGTFIYVGATEVIPEEWEEQDHKWKKFFALISGIVSIFMITQYTMELESHG